MRSLCGYLCALLLIASCAGPEKHDDTETKRSDTTAVHDHSEKDCKKLYASARRMDSILLSETEMNTAHAQSAISSFTSFAYYCENDSLSPVYLIKTAQVARAIDNLPRAKECLEKCIKDHPDFRDRPAAMFLLAQLYDGNNFMSDRHEAQKLYQQIIDEYPKSDWARSAKGNLVGKSDEEILMELKKAGKI
jgi:outer membrane protein assembly factor BamD (BamD/ComL family)